MTYYSRRKAMPPLLAKGWDESEHPRDDDGKFAGRGGGSAGGGGGKKVPDGGSGDWSKLDQVESKMREKRVGEVVRIRPEWREGHEGATEYRVVESNGNRVMIEPVRSSLKIKPIENVRLGMLED